MVEAKVVEEEEEAAGDQEEVEVAVKEVEVEGHAARECSPLAALVCRVLMVLQGNKASRAFRACRVYREQGVSPGDRDLQDQEEKKVNLHYIVESSVKLKNISDSHSYILS